MQTLYARTTRVHMYVQCNTYIVWIIPVKTTRVQSHCQSLLCPLCLIDVYRPWLRKPKILCPTSFRVSPSFRCSIWQMFSSFTYCASVVSFSYAGEFSPHIPCIPLFKRHFCFPHCFTYSFNAISCWHPIFCLKIPIISLLQSAVSFPLYFILFYFFLFVPYHL